MKGKAEIKIAWELWHIIIKIDHLFWNRYEKNFIDLILQDKDQKFLQARLL